MCYCIGFEDIAFPGWMPSRGLTVLVPIITGLVLSSIGGYGERSRIAYPAVFCALLEIWLFGPMMMSVSARFSGGGITQPGGWHLVLMGTCLFPLFTFMMSAYDGTLLALFLTTALLPFLPKLSFMRATLS